MKQKPEWLVLSEVVGPKSILSQPHYIFIYPTYKLFSYYLVTYLQAIQGHKYLVNPI